GRSGGERGLGGVLAVFTRPADRHPVAAQKLSHGRARADLGKKAVLFGAQHALPRCSLVALCRLLLEFPTAATAIYDVARRRIALLGRAMEHKPQKTEGPCRPRPSRSLSGYLAA